MHRVHSQKLIHNTLNGLVESNCLVFSEQRLVETTLPHLRVLSHLGLYDSLKGFLGGIYVKDFLQWSAL